MYTPAVLGWTVLGAIWLPAVMFVLHLALQIPELYAGQYEIALLSYAFFGALLGLSYGSGLALKHSGKCLSAGQTWLWFGIGFGFILLRSGFASSPFGGPARNFVLLFGVPFVCSMRLMAMGLRLIKQHPKDED